MPRKVVWHREWSATVVTANCLDCGWQYVPREGPKKTTIGLRVANVAEKHAECMGHRVVTHRIRLVAPTTRIKGAGSGEDTP